MRSDVPDRPHGELVYLTHLGEGESLLDLVVGLDRLPVYPFGRIGVPLDLEVLAQLLVADGAALGKELLDLLEDEGVALDGGRVVGFLEPDPAPDVRSLLGIRQAAHALPQLGDLHAGRPRGVAGVRGGSRRRG